MQHASAPGIGEHAFLSDCGGSALVGPHGEIDWLCVPRFDAPPLMWSILDAERGGAWTLEVADAAPVRRSYAGDSLVLETVWEGERCRLLCRDLLAVRPAGEGLEPVGALVRFLTCLDGDASVRSAVRARPDLGRAPARWEPEGEGGLRLGPDTILSGGPAPHVNADGDAEYRFDLGSGESAAMVLDHGGVREPCGTDTARRLAETTVESWRSWAARTTYEGEGAENVRRSAVVLRGLLHEESGGLVAAPTTSLPEWPGGPRNWDYRYVWHRDAPLVVLSFLRLGHTHEARIYLRYLLSATGPPITRLAPVHDLDGRTPPEETEVEGVHGYAGSRPVRVGNDAAEQHQLDVYGHVLDAVLSYQQAVGDLPEQKVRLADEVVEAIRSSWREPDEGIWEVRSGRRHWTISKVYAWVGLDRAVQLAELLGRQDEVPLQEWTADRDAVHTDVLEHGLDPATGTFTQAYGAPRTDGSLLKVPLLGFLDGRDPRVVRTLDRIADELGGPGALVHRYDPEGTDDGLRTPEGAFLLCSFGLVSALVLAGRADEAHERFARLCSRGGDLGLFAEEMSDDGAMLGNFPQAFTHLALIEAAVNLRDAGDTDALHAWARHRDGRSAHTENRESRGR